MANVMGWQKYLNLRAESTWGTHNGGGTSILLPYTDYGVTVGVETTQAALFTGVRQRKHNRFLRNTLSGSLACPLWGHHSNSASLAQHLTTWATSAPAGISLDSYSADLYDGGNDDKRHLGLRVNSMTLAGDASSGQVTISLDLIGKEEQGGASVPSLSATAAQPVDFIFSDVDFWISSESEGESATGTSESLSIRSFSITVNNNLQVYHTDSQWPSVVPAGVREVSFQFSLFKDANTYDALRRTSGVTNRAAHLRMTCPHNGTGASGTNTQLDVYFDKLNFSNATDQGGLNELINQNVDWIALKPSTSENDIEFAYSLV